MREEEIETPKKKKSGRFGFAKFIVVCLIVGFALGAFLQHQFIEPALGASAKKLAECESTNKLLNGEIESCYKQLADLNAQSSKIES